MTRPTLSAFVTAASAVVVLALVACTPPKEQVSPDNESTAAPVEEPIVPAEPVDDVYDQDLVWEECGNLECAYIQVPVDWSEPDGDQVTLSLNRHLAEDQTQRVGSLLTNPGGPGASGLELLEYFTVTAGADLLERYDIIGFDPRGVGASTPVQCGTDEQVNEFYLTDFLIESQEDMDEADEIARAFAENCRVESGAIIENVDTSSAARDMDVIRAAVGDEKLNYLGFSYGTQLGATYAELHPDKVGRLVLDGAVDFLLPGIETARGQAEGFENALTNFLRWCSASGDCPLTGGLAAQKAQLSELMETSLTNPYPTGTDWGLNGNLFVYGVVVTLYDEASWTFLQMALEEVIEEGTAGFLYELAGFYLSRDGATGEYLDNSTWAFTAIGCLDGDPSEEWTIEDQLEFRAEMQEASPTFGWWFASGVGCGDWPWAAKEPITSLDQAATASDNILIIGTTHDPATPLKWSESLADRLGATLLTYDGEGHTAYGRSNQCIIDAVDGFLVDGEMPVSGKQC